MDPVLASIDQAVAWLADQNGLRTGDPLLKGSRYTIAFGGDAMDGIWYLVLDGDRLVQRRKLPHNPFVNHRTVGACAGNSGVGHRMVLHPTRGLMAEVGNAATGQFERLNLCVPWPTELAPQAAQNT